MNIRKEILLLQKSYFLLLLLFLASIAVNSQNKMEQLDRGLVAVPLEDGNVFLSWRMFQSDSPETSFDIYRGEKK